MTDLQIIEAMLDRAGIDHTREEPDRNPDGFIAIDIEHDGFTQAFTQWKFTPEGKLLVVTAGW